MALLGYRVPQRSVLWPLVAVLMAGWVAIVWLWQPAPNAEALQASPDRHQPAFILASVAGLLALLPALLLLFRHPWPRFIWAERIQALWPLALVLLAVSLRGVGSLAGRFINGFISSFVTGAVYRSGDPAGNAFYDTVFTALNLALAVVLVWMVKEIVGGRSSKLHEILGFDQYDLREWRLWLVALGMGVPLALLGGPVLKQKALFAILVAPVIEEIIYRGFLLSALRNWCGPWLAAVLSSALYAGLQAHLPPSGIAFTFLQGLVFCLVKLKTQRLAAAMMTHSVFGLVSVLGR